MIAEIDLLYFFIQPSVFSKHVKLDDLQLPPEGVYVVWKWKWDICTDSENEELDTSKEVESEDEENLIEDTENDHEEVTHTVTFKCIGATKTPESQVALKTISELLASGNHVPVDLFPEPQNPYDSRTIVFKAMLNGDWHSIGYVVREIMEYVHSAIEKKEIIDVKFAWAKYLLVWYRCGPGYYAGVDVTVRGKWPDAVVRCASTK